MLLTINYPTLLLGAHQNLKFGVVGVLRKPDNILTCLAPSTVFHLIIRVRSVITFEALILKDLIN